MVAFANLPLNLGLVTISAAASAAVAGSEETLRLLVRHGNGDWGDVDDEERLANWVALSHGTGLVCSAYRLAAGPVVLIATEMTPRQTSVLLAEEA
jgi:hypothetical protein